MGYIQASTGIVQAGPGVPVMFTQPICAQLAIQVSTDTGGGSVNLETSLDGINFIPALTCSAGQMNGSQRQNFGPIAAMRYNVLAVSGTLSITIAAAPLGG